MSLTNKVVTCLACAAVGGAIAFTIRNGVRRRFSAGAKSPNNGAGIHSSDSACKYQTSLLDLPPLVRKLIWDKLNYRDHLNIRQVCLEFNDDILNIVGVNGTIDTEHRRSYEFFKTVGLKHCKIKNLSEIITSEFFYAPILLESLELEDESPIPFENIGNLLHSLSHLRKLQLTLRFAPQGVGMASTFSSFPSLILQSLREMPCLEHLQIQKMWSQPADNAGFHIFTPSSTSFLGSSRKITYLEILLPDFDMRYLPDWKKYLEQQTCIQTLSLYFGSLFWKYFETVIQKNSSTLRKLKLHGLTNWNPSTDQNEPLDFTILQYAINLNSLELNKATTGRFGYAGMRETGLLSNVNFHRIPFDNIQEFFLRGVALDLESVRLVYHYMPNFRSGGLSMIGDEGIAAAAELAWQLHEQRRAPQRLTFPSETMVEFLFHFFIMATTLTLIIASTHWRRPDGS